MIVAIAEPKPIRLASPTMFWVTSTESSSSPLRPLLIDPDDVEGAQRLDDRDDQDDDVDRAHHREDDPEERLRLDGAVDRGGLAQRRVDAPSARPGRAS